MFLKNKTWIHLGLRMIISVRMNWNIIDDYIERKGRWWFGERRDWILGRRNNIWPSLSTHHWFLGHSCREGLKAGSWECGEVSKGRNSLPNVVGYNSSWQFTAFPQSEDFLNCATCYQVKPMPAQPGWCFCFELLPGSWCWESCHYLNIYGCVPTSKIYTVGKSRNGTAKWSYTPHGHFTGVYLLKCQRKKPSSFWDNQAGKACCWSTPISLTQVLATMFSWWLRRPLLSHGKLPASGVVWIWRIMRVSVKVD